MKKYATKLSIAFVCALLGFMITYQIKTINRQTEGVDTKNSAEIILENEQLGKQKDEYEQKLKEVEDKLKDYEKAAAGKDSETQIMLKQLDKLRNINGSTDVEGQGMIIYITPKSSIVPSGFSSQPITDLDLVDIVNELYAGEAEAISINDIRVTGRTGIRTAGNAIIINNERISFDKQVVIKAIGDKQLLEAAISFPGSIPDSLKQNCEVKWELKDKIKIGKANAPTEEFKYAKPVDEE